MPDQFHTLFEGDHEARHSRVGDWQYTHALDGHEKIIEGFIRAYENDEIVNSILSLQEKHNRIRDISDMDINRRRDTPIKFPNIPLCNHNFSNEGWRESKLVHYHNGLWNHFKNHQCKKRSDFIKMERPV